MICKDIQTTNLVLLYQYYLTSKKGSDELFNLVGNIDGIVSRVVIRYHISDIRSIELIALRSMSSIVKYNLVDNGTTCMSDLMEYTQCTKLTPDISARLVGWNKKAMKYNHGIVNTFPTLPIGASAYDVFVIFTGKEILSLINFDIGILFKIKDQNLSLEKNVENTLTELLITSIYDRVNKMLENQDMISDSYLFSKIYNVTKGHRFVIESIKNDCGGYVPFLNTTKEELYQNKKNMITSIKENTQTHWFISISCDTPISYYLYLLRELYSHKKLIRISDHSDYGCIMGLENNLEIPKIFANEEDQKLLGESLNEYATWFSNYIKDKSNKTLFFHHFYLMPSWKHISYTITISLYNTYEITTILEIFEHLYDEYNQFRITLSNIKNIIDNFLMEAKNE